WDLSGEAREHRLVLPTRLCGRGGGALLVPAPDQEPVLLLAVEVRRDERPHAVEPLAVQPHLELTAALLLEQLVGAVVPDLDRAGPVLAGRDLACKGGVFERMVIHVDGERARTGLHRHPLRHRPGGEHTVALEPEVVVEAAGVMALNDEDRLRAPLAPAEGLRRLLRVALRAVVGQLRHRPVHSPVWKMRFY